MTLTAEEAVNILADYLRGTEMATAINGTIREMQRLINSTKEDVIVNTTGLTNEPVQQGLVSVNIYVPNRPIQVGNTMDNTQPDLPRLRTLSKLASGLLDDVWLQGGTVNFTTQSNNTFADDNNQHYSSFRIIFRHLNI